MRSETPEPCWKCGTPTYYFYNSERGEARTFFLCEKCVEEQYEFGA